MQQEVFGPVLPISTFKTLDEAIKTQMTANRG